MTRIDPLREAARITPGALALAWPSDTWRYAELDARVDALAGALIAKGLVQGDRLVLHAPNSPDAVVLLWACWRSGIVFAPVGPRWPDASAQERANAIGAALYLDADALADVAKNHLPPLTSHVPLHASASATIVWTSGSSGAPKAAVHSARNHLASAQGVVSLLAMDAGSRYLLTLPLASVGGLAVAVRCASAGAALMLPEVGEPLVAALRRTEATHVSLVSTHLVRLLGEAQSDDALARLLPRVQMLLGGSAMPPHALAEAAQRGLRVAPGYGLTEMASTVTAVRPGAGAEALATSGRVLPHRALRLDDVGEIHVHGATRFLGYLDALDPASSAPVVREPFDARGWFATGDLGVLDAHGRLRVTGRRGNRFVSGGANVQPEAIEAALLTHRAVHRAVVVPIPSATFGQRPVAFVEVDGAHAETVTPRLARDLDRAVRARLPGFMAPDGYHGWPVGATLPGSSKPDRAAFRRFIEALPENQARGLTIS